MNAKSLIKRNYEKHPEIDFPDYKSSIFRAPKNRKISFPSSNTEIIGPIFNKNIIAIYENSKLTADKADYSNTLGLLTISDKVKVIDYRGSLDADKLTFDLNNQTLNVASYNNDSINADIKLK